MLAGCSEATLSGERRIVCTPTLANILILSITTSRFSTYPKFDTKNDDGYNSVCFIL